MDPYIRKAVQLARRSNHKHHTHGCVIVSNEDGSVVAEGYNHLLTRPLKDTYSVHAEMHALAKFGHCNRRKFKNCSMFIVRVGKRGLMCSKPCSTCQKLIEQCPCIRRVYYTEHAS